MTTEYCFISSECSGFVRGLLNKLVKPFIVGAANLLDNLCSMS